MLPRPSRLKSVASEFSPVLTTPPPVEPNTVLVLMSVPPMMLSSNLTVRRRRAAISAAIPAERREGAPADHPAGRAAEEIVEERRRLCRVPWWRPPSVRAPWRGAPSSAARRRRGDGRPWAARRLRLGAAATFAAARSLRRLDLGRLDFRRLRRLDQRRRCGGSVLAGGVAAALDGGAARRARRLAALERERALQILQRLLELGDARLRFLERLVARHDFFGDLALARLRRHLELIATGRRRRHPFFDRRADPSAGTRAPAAASEGGAAAGDLVLIAAPIGGLQADGLLRPRSARVAAACSALGMLRIAPARSRFMLPSNASGLLL